MNVLIVKTSSLGDIIHTLPALTDAKNAIPNINFDWVVEEDFAQIPSWHQSVKNVYPIALRRLRKNLIKTLFSNELPTALKPLRQKKYDLIIDTQGLIKSAIITTIAHGHSCGYSINSIREKCAALFYRKRFTVDKNQHAITRIRKLFSAALKYETPTNTPDYHINKNLFQQTQPNEKYIVFLHGTSREEKCWNEQKWIELAQFAAANGFTVYVPWGNSAEFARAKRIAQNNKAKVLPKLNLLSIATLLLNAKCVVAVDTGLGHLAAALETFTISLYGPTDPKLIGTVGKNVVHMINFEQLEAADVWQAFKKSQT
jgi:heptosyltransferase I